MEKPPHQYSPTCQTQPMPARPRPRIPAGFIVAAVVAVAALGCLAVTELWPRFTTETVTTTPGIPPQATEATIDYVHDGDTLSLTDGRKVRLLGINTPEIGDNLECYGDEATALLRSLLPAGTHVWVQADIEPLDQYDRSLLFIYTDDATNINLELLSQGAAEVEMYEPNLLLRAQVVEAEEAARAANVGMWGAC
ncbi:MAG: thermonuclease [Rhodoglobus sp.]|nr:thermonuclease [Rhodoglobus sp.]